MHPCSNMPTNSVAHPNLSYCYYLYVAVELTFLYSHSIIRTFLHKEKTHKIKYNAFLKA